MARTGYGWSMPKTKAVALPRPVSVLIVSVLVMVVGAFTLGQKIFVILTPEVWETFRAVFDELNAVAPLQLPLEAHLAFSFIASAVYLVAGACMLAGQNWARVLLLVWGPIAIGFGGLTAGVSFLLILKSTVYLVLLYLLTRASVRAFFTSVP